MSWAKGMVMGKGMMDGGWWKGRVSPKGGNGGKGGGGCRAGLARWESVADEALGQNNIDTTSTWTFIYPHSTRSVQQAR